MVFIEVNQVQDVMYYVYQEMEVVDFDILENLIYKLDKLQW